MIVIRPGELVPSARRARPGQVVVVMRTGMSVNDMVMVRNAVQTLVLQRMSVWLRV